MKRPLVKRLVLGAVIGTSVSMLLMVAGVLFPTPLLLVLVMSVGQALGILSLALFLLAVTLDIQGAVAGEYQYLPGDGEEPGATRAADAAPPRIDRA